MDIFCERLKVYRERRSWTQSELARRAGVPPPVISRLESGARVGLTLEVARRLARALHVGLDALAGTFDEDTDTPQVEALPPELPAPEVPRRGRPRKTASVAPASATG